MICPYCDHDAPPRALHAHLVDQHADQVQVVDTGTQRSYDISCPVCGVGYSQPIKPRLLDAAFLEEFDREIRLVAFDRLINHLLAEHSETETHLPDPRSHGGSDDHRP